MFKAAKPKKPPLTALDAYFKVGSMVRLMERDIHEAIWIEAVLEAGNKRVMASVHDSFDGDGSYNAIAHSLKITLAVTVSRLFDEGNARYVPDERDVASIPLLVRLLARGDVRSMFIDHARSHIDGRGQTYAEVVASGLDKAVEHYDTFHRSDTGKAAVAKLKEMRDIGIAHRLLKPADLDLPTYNELFLLIDTARDVMHGALTAMSAEEPDLLAKETEWLEEAAAFWARAIPADAPI